MERTASLKEASHAKLDKVNKVAPTSRRGVDKVASLRLGLAALAAILAGPACGGEAVQEGTPDADTADASTPVPVPVCETPERADAPAPRVMVQTDNIQLKGNRIRIGFDVPAFDAECRAPFMVHARAMVWRNPEEVSLGEEPSEEPLSSPGELLRGETAVHEPGEYFLDAEFPPHAARISSLVLEVVDAAGQDFTTPPFSPLE